jgi:pimeloyl-ACP methyl ester carboxylesterase
VFTERSVSANGLQLNVAEGPKSGAPLWLFHGLGRRWQDFNPLLPDLTALWTVRALDHRGHGRSARAGGQYRVTDYVADAISVVFTHHELPVLVGHSLGALVALGVAAKNVEAVRAVVLIDPPGPGFLANIEGTIYAATWPEMRRLAWSSRPSGDNARLLAELRVPGPKPGETVRLGELRDMTALRFLGRCLRDLDPDAMTPAIEGGWLDGFDLLAAAKLVNCPTLLLVSDPACGGMLPPADADPLTAALAERVRIDLPGVGHLPHWQDAATTCRLLHSFLGSL